MRSIVLWIVLIASGCGGSGVGSAAREPDEYTGCASDEHWRTFDDQEPHAIVDDTKAPVFTNPADGATLPATPVPVFAWNPDPNDPGSNDGDVMHDGPGCNMCCPEYNIGALTTLHLPPISGSVYDLQFFSGGDMVHRVVSTLQEWGPKADTWTSFRGKTITLKIYKAALLFNDVKEGPYVGTRPLTFTVGR
jgi:hypothetical protein